MAAGVIEYKMRHENDKPHGGKNMKAFVKEFKEFISRGNVMDMAVGIIIGGAFTAIVTSLVDDILMPLLSLITGGIDFTALCIVFGEGENAATLNYGSFIAAIINFLLIAVVIFFLLKAFNKMSSLRKKEEEPKAETTKMCPYCREKIAIEATRCPHCTSELK
jgi:large conductance mechanosensitive channel